MYKLQALITGGSGPYRVSGPSRALRAETMTITLPHQISIRLEKLSFAGKCLGYVADRCGLRADNEKAINVDDLSARTCDTTAQVPITERRRAASHVLRWTIHDLWDLERAGQYKTLGNSYQTNVHNLP
ncbi:hypothetical protein EVAR_31624_1 [Eumeta japonica]|uniref:Uncharacterized protein n=1 Tax=Eumeta variegata TaxID=151549 RepID=A0A4C1VZZ9_EUMVA|nr:hypothetical protein EVAR_31624_1 [Eumeta japonica]